MKCLIIIGRHAYGDACVLHGQLAMYVLKQCLHLYVNACYMLGDIKIHNEILYNSDYICSVE